jgi:hypothetical protein
MYRVAGEVVDPKIRPGGQERVNLHQMPGSHSLDQLNRTIKAKLDTSRQGDQLKVVVTIANKAAGHYVPTGSPLRQLVLELRVDTSDDHHFKEERIYRRVVADQHGTPLNREHFVFVKAAKTLEDTRLAPDERRREEFSYNVGRVQMNVSNAFTFIRPSSVPSRSSVLCSCRLVRIIKICGYRKMKADTASPVFLC